MPEKKRGGVEPFPNLRVGVTPISVARNRGIEPYVKTFSFSPENVTQESLGTLVGAFSVSDRSEASAYTVNVIASVARKEYYANPRRGAIESFESTLHRINLALSELVKNGQTSWMGALNGAIAVIEKQNIHFSATGAGGIFLFRDGTIADIGDGLASDEAATHPLKTFLEISSGRLAPKDCILLSTPELFGLFSLRDLERNANRLLPDGRFQRFLETAMVNELRSGAAVVLDIRESEQPSSAAETDRPKRKRTAKQETVNAWSEAAFREAQRKRTESIIETHDPKDDIIPEPEQDIEAPPSSEIRIQGEMPGNADEHPLVTRIRWMAEDASRWISGRFEHSIRETRRRGSDAVRNLSSGITSATEAVQSKRDRPDIRPILHETTVKRPETGSTPVRRPHRNPVPETNAVHRSESPRTPVPKRTPRRENAPPAISWRSKTAAFSERITATTISTTHTTAVFFRNRVAPALGHAGKLAAKWTGTAARKSFQTSKAIARRFMLLPPKRQLVVGAGAAFLLTIAGIAIWKGLPERKPAAAPVAEIETPSSEPFPPTDEPKARLADFQALPSSTEPVIAPVYLGDTLYIVTDRSIRNPGNGTSSPSPASGSIRLAASMQDLGLIFFLTDDGELYSYAPSNRSFVKNTISFPSGFRPVAMGDFLTYLYFLDSDSGTIYRFPRADGGFGEGTLWTKSPLPPGTRSLAVSENIYVAEGSPVTSLLKGNRTDGFSSPATKAPLTVTSLCANSDVSDRLVVLDAPEKRIVIADDTGHIVTQIFDESFSTATACALSSDGKTIAVSGETGAGTITLSE
ncbi:MAG: hypothetical protein HGA38_04225 [Candidatus Moranbacteria bacterium]|nr:hypothetical protein [Candidatus Moranbacteria bacterium]